MKILPGLLLASNGLMYGTTEAAGDGAVYSYNPLSKAFKPIAAFGSNTGGVPVAALFEGTDKHLYGTASLYGGTNARGNGSGTIYRLDPVLRK